jgi:hypothetical protein
MVSGSPVVALAETVAMGSGSPMVFVAFGLLTVSVVSNSLPLEPLFVAETETEAMVSGSPVVTIAEPVAMDSGSPAISVASGLPTVSVVSNSLTKLSLVPHLVSDVGLESLDVGDLGELSGPSPVSLALVACDDSIPLQR